MDSPAIPGGGRPVRWSSVYLHLLRYLQLGFRLDMGVLVVISVLVVVSDSRFGFGRRG